MKQEEKPFTCKHLKEGKCQLANKETDQAKGAYRYDKVDGKCYSDAYRRAFGLKCFREDDVLH